MIKYIFVSLILFSTFFSSAQLGIGKPKDIAVFNSRKKVLLLGEGYSSDVVQKYSKRKPELVSKHKKMIDEYNRTLYHTALNHPLFEGKSIEIKSGIDIMSIPKNERTNYIVVYGTNNAEGADPTRHKMIITEDIPGVMLINNVRILFYLLEDPTKHSAAPLYVHQTRSVVPSSLDIKTAFDITKKYFYYRLNSKAPLLKRFDQGLLTESRRSKQELKNYTIYIQKGHVHPKAELPSFLKIKIVEKGDFEKLVAQADSNTAYWYPLISSGTTIQLILSTTDDKLLYYGRPSAGKSYLSAYASSKYLIDKKAMSQFVEASK